MLCDISFDTEIEFLFEIFFFYVLPQNEIVSYVLCTVFLRVESMLEVCERWMEVEKAFISLLKRMLGLHRKCNTF